MLPTPSPARPRGNFWRMFLAPGMALFVLLGSQPADAGDDDQFIHYLRLLQGECDIAKSINEFNINLLELKLRISKVNQFNNEEELKERYRLGSTLPDCDFDPASLRSSSEAFAFVKKFTERTPGFSPGIYALGKFYRNGLGVDKNEAEAFRLFGKAAEQDHEDAQRELGDMYLRGEGTAKDPVEALRWFRKAAEQGRQFVQNELGNMYLYGKGAAKNTEEVFKWLKKTAEQGNQFAQKELGEMYLRGESAAKDPVEAFKWFRKAAEQGNKDAQRRLGGMYFRGEGIARNVEEAFRWLERSVDNDSRKRTLERIEAALKNRKVAERGNTEAQFDLGRAYAHPWLGDDVEAFSWFMKAAERGHVKAQFRLGMIYEKGTASVAKDEVEALKWYGKAAAQGDENAQRRLQKWQPEQSRGQKTEGRGQRAESRRQMTDDR